MKQLPEFVIVCRCLKQMLLLTGTRTSSVTGVQLHSKLLSVNLKDLFHTFSLPTILPSNSRENTSLRFIVDHVHIKKVCFFLILIEDFRSTTKCDSIKFSVSI